MLFLLVELTFNTIGNDKLMPKYCEVFSEKHEKLKFMSFIDCTFVAAKEGGSKIGKIKNIKAELL